MAKLSKVQEYALTLLDQGVSLNLRLSVTRQTVASLIRAGYITESESSPRQHSITESGHALLWQEADEQEMSRRRKDDGR